MVLRIGTRRSALALVQANAVKTRLEHEGLACALVEIESRGDKNVTSPLYEIDLSEPGLFTKQLESHLLDHSIDIAVHSLKDLPTKQPSGLVVQAVLQREEVGDVLIVHPKHFSKESTLPLHKGSIFGTSSLRREAQLFAQSKELHVVPIRGNVPTRIQAVREERVHATILARAGLNRLGLSLEGLVEFNLPTDSFVPAPGQGAIAIETRTDLEFSNILKKINDTKTEIETRIERRVLSALEGGCTLPLGVLARLEESQIFLKAFLGKFEVLSAGRRNWLSFHAFESYSENEEKLISETVSYFKDL